MEKNKTKHKTTILQEIGNKIIRQSDPTFISKMKICKHSQEKKKIWRKIWPKV